MLPYLLRVHRHIKNMSGTSHVYVPEFADLC